MSVINQMLRDLDKQRQQQNQPVRATKAPKPQRVRLGVMLFGAIVLAGMAYWLGMHNASVFPAPSVPPTAKPEFAQPKQIGAELGQQRPAESALAPTTSAKSELVNATAANPELTEQEPTAQNSTEQLLQPATKMASAQTRQAQPQKQPKQQLELSEQNTPVEEQAKALKLASKSAPNPVMELKSHPTILSTSTPNAAEHQAPGNVSDVESQPITIASNEAVATAMMPEVFTEPSEQVTSRAQMSVSQSSTFEQAQHLYQQYVQARSNGQFALAETSLRQLQLIDPQQALPLLAELYWQQQQGAQLDAVLLAAQNANVSDSQLVRFQLLRLQQQQRWSELIPQLTETRMAELGVEFIAMKAQALWQTAQYAQALPIYQRWTTEAPTDARAWLGQALVLEKLQQPSAAKKAYQQALTHGGLSVASLQFIQQRLAALKE